MISGGNGNTLQFVVFVVKVGMVLIFRVRDAITIIVVVLVIFIGDTIAIVISVMGVGNAVIIVIRIINIRNSITIRIPSSGLSHAQEAEKTQCKYPPLHFDEFFLSCC